MKKKLKTKNWLSIYTRSNESFEVKKLYLVLSQIYPLIVNIIPNDLFKHPS